MKKLAIIAVVLVGALGVVGSAVAKPTGNYVGQLEEIGAWAVPTSTQPAEPVRMTPAEARALLVRSEGLNRKYGLGVESLTLERGSSDRFAADNPARDDLVTSTPPETSSSFAWGDAGIGAGVLLGIMALIGAGFFEVRHHGRLGTS